MVTVFKTAGKSTITGLPRLRRDAMLDDDNGGVRYLFDIPFRFCWPGENPSNGDIVYDVAEAGNGSFVATGAGTIKSGGGFDFAAPISGRAYVAGPAGCLASIAAGNQYFLAVGWYKLPLSSAWFATPANVAPIFQCAATTYSTGPELVTWLQTSLPRLDLRRQTNGATYQAGNLVPDANIFGQVTQIAYWRNAAGVGMRAKSALGQVMSTLGVDVANLGNFSAMIPKWGVAPGFVAAPNFRLYRGWIEDLQVSGRNPLTVLDADFAACMARGAFV